MISYYLFVPFLVLLIILFGLALFDHLKHRKLKLKNKVKITFLIPCWNDGDTIEGTIKSVYSVYDNFELIVINDKSTDNSLDILKKLQKKYGFTLLDHKVNMGKVKSMNEAVEHVKTDIFFVIDSDVILNKKAIEDVLIRFENNKKLGAVSCKYKVSNKGFWAAMLEIEYNLLGVIQWAYNIMFTPSMWGGCMAVRKNVFLKVGKLSENAICEDTDMALKIIKNKFKVEQGSYGILTKVPDSFRDWWKQRIRWHSGFTQCLVKYPIIWLKNPISVIFILIYLVIIIMSLIYLPSAIIRSISINDVLFSFSFILLSLPYVLMTVRSIKEGYKLSWVIPYSIIYAPLLSINFIVGFLVYLKRHSKLQKGERGW